MLAFHTRRRHNQFLASGHAQGTLLESHGLACVPKALICSFIAVLLFFQELIALTLGRQRVHPVLEQFNACSCRLSFAFMILGPAFCLQQQDLM